MRRHILLAATATVTLAVPFACAPAMAETLQDALRKAYDSNPTLTAERANVRAADENVTIAKSRSLPTVNIQSTYTEVLQNAANNIFAPERQVTAQGQIGLPLYQGGDVKNSVRGAKARVEASRMNLRGTESQLFTGVVGAYMDVIRDEAIVALNAQNVRVLEVNLQATRDRFEVGDLTRTDVAQSEARLALARGQLQSAEARLISSRETYVQLVGSAPENLEAPPPVPGTPANPDEAVDVALNSNPNVLAARKASDAAGFDTKAARAARLPDLSLSVGGNYINYLGTLQSQIGPIPQTARGAQANVTLTVPLYQGGRPAAQIRQAQARESAAIEQVTAAERDVIARVRSAYAVWKSSEDVIRSAEIAVAANKLSLEGVRAENSVGNRTILDILNAEQELLNSQVTLVTARRDAYVARFALQAAMGKAEARDLGLEGGPLYDPVTNYDRVTDRIWDWDEDGKPVAIAPGTKGTPAQNATVTRKPDPTVDR